MGWFNDSDSEDENEKRSKRPLLETFHDVVGGGSSEGDSSTTVHQPNKKSKVILENSGDRSDSRAAAAVEEEEEVDPLDAFMSNLSSSKNKSTSTASTNSSTRTKQLSRMDMDNEDEATAHWESSKATDNIHAEYSEQQQQEHQQQNKTQFQSQQISKVKLDMSNTFHKAGEKNKTSNSSNSCFNKSNDSDQDEMLNRIQKQKQNDQEHYQLDKINHSKMMKSSQYKPFCKVFLNPNMIRQMMKKYENNMNYGYEWRIEHNVTCSIDYIDPIESFQLYGGEYSSSSSSSRNNINEDNHQKKSTTTSSSNDNAVETYINKIFDYEVLKYLEKNNFKKATLVQAQSIPIALCGKDLIVTSHTGR